MAGIVKETRNVLFLTSEIAAFVTGYKYIVVALELCFSALTTLRWVDFNLPNSPASQWLARESWKLKPIHLDIAKAETLGYSFKDFQDFIVFQFVQQGYPCSYYIGTFCNIMLANISAVKPVWQLKWNHKNNTLSR